MSLLKVDVGPRLYGVHMFESTVAGRSRKAAVVDAASAFTGPDAIAYELNGAWTEQDWTDVPIWSRSDQPPPGGDPDRGGNGDRSWLDEVAEPQRGPVEWLRDVAPSGVLMTDLEHLPHDVVASDADAVEMVAHWHRLEAYCGMQKRLAAGDLARRSTMAHGLAALSGLSARSVDRNIAGDEIAVRIGTGRRAAATLVRSGQAFTGVGIPTCDALAAGLIDAGKADLIVAGVHNLGPDAAIAVQDQVLAGAAHVPSGRVRRELAEAVAQVDPEHYEERCQTAMQCRRVDRPRVLPDGMASLYAVMPGVEATQLYRTLDAAARSAKTTGDARTLDQLRADALGLMGVTAVQTGWIGSCPAPPELAVEDEGCERRSEQLRLSDLPGWARDDHTARHPGAAGDAGSAADPTSATPLPNTPTKTAHDPPSRPRAGGGRPRESPPGIPEHTGEAEHPGRREHAGPSKHMGEAEHAAGPEQARPPDRVEQATGLSVSAASGGGCGMRVGVIGGRSAHIRVVVPLTTLMGGSGGPAADLEGADTPATLEGYGPIPASVARALAAGGPWARMVTNPIDRTVLELSRDTYAPPASMADLVRAREPECVEPSCGISSDGCDLHHRIPWPVGATEVANLDPGCRRHHLLITHGGWTYEVEDRRGTRTWRTAAGLVYAEDDRGDLVLQRPRERTAAQEAAATALRRLHAGPPPF